MDIKLTEEQTQLVDSAKKFMDNECTPEFVRGIEGGEEGYSKDMWKKMADMGWLAIHIADDCGGLGMDFLDLVLLIREFGRRLCPSPYLGTAVIAGDAINRAGTAEQREKYLNEIAAGETTFALAYQEVSRSFNAGAVRMTATTEGDDFVLNGVKMFVEHAANVDKLLVVARTSGEVELEKTRVDSGLTMFIVDAKATGVNTKKLPIAAREHQYEVTFDNVKVSKADVLGDVDKAWDTLEITMYKAVLAFSAYTNGASFELQAQATQFSKERVQFDRPIGQMQVIQGYLAQMIIEIYGADMLTTFAAFNLDRDRDVRGYVAKAKAFSSETVGKVMDVGSQIFGGMGYMEESDTTLYLRRGKQYQHMYGGTDYWLEVLAEEIIDREDPVVLT